ncbi:amidohydrolase family protein [Desulfoscipio sp. XC116]|uniref:amidohydrolase family protein n=1 Tax=Desulfoscipio sp. XC116 TaxID=3144975 RepID=UPI00325BD91F
MEKIWDAHVHLFPQRLFNAIWHWFNNIGWQIPYAGWELERYVACLKAMGVERAFLLTYAHKSDISLELNRWVRDVCRKHDCFIPFACIHPLDRDLEQIIATVLDDWQFAGFKLQLAVQQYAADDPVWEPVYRAAVERQKPVIIHAGTAPYSQNDPVLGLDHMEKVMERWPELKVIIPHLGLYEIDKAFSLLERYPHFYLDTSWALGATGVNLPVDRLVYFIERYPQRFLYGSDFPIIEYELASGLKILRQLGLADQVLRRVVYDNARNLVANCL